MSPETEDTTMTLFRIRMRSAPRGSLKADWGTTSRSQLCTVRIAVSGKTPARMCRSPADRCTLSLRGRRRNPVTSLKRILGEREDAEGKETLMGRKFLQVVYQAAFIHTGKLATAK